MRFKTIQFSGMRMSITNKQTNKIELQLVFRPYKKIGIHSCKVSNLKINTQCMVNKQILLHI